MKGLEATRNILGIVIHRDMSVRMLSVSQKSYLVKILNIFGTSNLKPILVPMGSKFKLYINLCHKNEKEIEKMRKIPYASVACSLCLP